MSDVEFIGNYTRIEGLIPSEEELSELCMRKGCLYQLTGNGVIIPRGFTATAYRWILKRGGGALKYYAPNIEPQLPEPITNRLRDYQVEVLTDTLRYLRMQGAATITMPTGGGKTYSIAGLIKYMLDSGYVKKVYFFAHTNDLVLQAADWFANWGLDVGVVGGGKFDPDHQVVASTLQTMYRSLRDLAVSGKITQPEGIKVTEYSTPISLPVNKAIEPLIEVVASDEDNEEGEYESLSESEKVDYSTEYINLGKDALVTVDECHHEPAHSIEYVLTANPHSLRIGMSASPWRGLDGLTKHIYAVLGNIVDRRVNSSELIAKGYLVPVLIVMYFRRPNIVKFIERYPDIKLEAGGKKLYDKLREFLFLYDEERLRDAVEVASIVPKPGVFILNDISPTLKMEKLLSGAGFRVESMIGLMSGEKRKQVLDKIREGKLDFVVTTKLFNEGVDVPALRSVVIMDGALSPVLILQRVGRVARPFPDKRFGVVVDFVDDTYYFRLHAVLRWMLYRSEPYWAVARTKSIAGVRSAIRHFEELNLDKGKMAKLFREIGSRRNWKAVLNILMNL